MLWGVISLEMCEKGFLGFSEQVLSDVPLNFTGPQDNITAVFIIANGPVVFLEPLLQLILV